MWLNFPRFSFWISFYYWPCFFVPSTIIPHSCSILPPVSSSDCNSILFSIPVLSPKPVSSPPHHTWLYNQADFDHANSILSSIPWADILPLCPDTTWTIFKELFLRTIHICILSSTPLLASSVSLPRDLLCSPDDVLHLILKSPTNVASGPDEISAIMLHNTANSISLPLSLIF